MRKITLFLMSLFLTVGAMAQTPVLELTADEIGTTYPKQLSDDDAAIVYGLTDLTVAVRVITEGTSGRRGLFVTSDPTLEKNTAAEGTNSRYVAYGLYGQKLSYLASWRDGDRFTGNSQTFTANQEMTCVYVINPTNGKCELYLDGNLAGNWSGNLNGFSDGYEIATPAMVKAAHENAKIYLGGGMSSTGAGETFGGRNLGLKFYSGALSSPEIAAISFEDPALLAQAREAFNTAYAAAQAILNEAELNVTSTELPLQVTAEGSDYYLWTNNPESSEGPIANLVDGVKTKASFFHTNWHGGGEEPHYIEVDLGENNKLAEFSFKYMTRFEVANDYPDGIQVLGSNDKSAYSEIYKVESGLPQTGATEWTSNIISSKTAYRYLRFVVTAERTYWHMTEFDIVTNSFSVAPKYSAVVKKVVALKNIYDAHASNQSYGTVRLNEAAAAINALVETVNAGAVEPEFTYESIDKPTFAKGGNTTKVGMIDFNGDNLTGFTYTQGATNHFNMPQVEAGKTYSLNLTYEMAWGDLAIFQIDKNNNEKKYGYYTCVWEANASPFNILVNNAANQELMCGELGISSLQELDATSAGDYTYLTIPYEITIDENLEVGDIVVVRVMVGKSDNGAYNAKNIAEGGCLDLVFTVKEPEVVPVELVAGKYYRLKGNNGEYLTNDGTGYPYTTTLQTKSEADINSIFYIEQGDAENKFYILSYENGHYVANPYRIGVGEEAIDDDEIYKQQWEITGSNGVYTFKYGSGYYMTNPATGGTYYSADVNESARWTLEEVTELPVTISAAGWATFYAPVEVEKPEGVNAYYLLSDGVKNGYVTMEEITIDI
ncbi:MAG: discoidin domain-containing protein, partial [Bacteroidaceae bacterium]|nr:discoidin domain-containing protein [Bacteroidaceae bacterium]